MLYRQFHQKASKLLAAPGQFFQTPHHLCHKEINLEQFRHNCL